MDARHFLPLGKKKNADFLGEVPAVGGFSCYEKQEVAASLKTKAAVAAVAAAGLRVEPELRNVSPLLEEKRRLSIVFPTGFQYRVQQNMQHVCWKLSSHFWICFLFKKSLLKTLQTEHRGFNINLFLVRQSVAN